MVSKQNSTTLHRLQATILTPPTKRIPDEILEIAKKASTATISFVLFRQNFRFIYMAGVQPLRPGTVMAGRAYTLRYLPRREDYSQLMGEDRRNYAEHIAIESIGPGEVLVVDARGNTDAGIFGDLLTSRIKYRGAAGVVTDGAVRDTPYLKSMDFPFFVRGAHGYGHIAEHWASDVQLPIACGNVTVCPGDLVVGDDDGVVVCPQAIAEEVVKEAMSTEEHEMFVRELITNQGVSVNDYHPLTPEMQAQFEKWRKTHKL